MVDWKSIEDTIGQWFVKATGLPENHVLWANKRLVEPPRPFAKLKRISWVNIGGIGDEVEDSFNADAPVGQEVEFTVAGRRKFTVSCQVWSTPVVGGAQPTISAISERTALDYLTDAEGSLSLPSVVDYFNSNQLASGETGTIHDLPEGKDGTAWSSRAQMDVTFSCCNLSHDNIGYIAEVEGKVVARNPDGTIAVSVPFDFKLP